MSHSQILPTTLPLNHSTHFQVHWKLIRLIGNTNILCFRQQNDGIHGIEILIRSIYAMCPSSDTTPTESIFHLLHVDHAIISIAPMSHINNIPYVCLATHYTIEFRFLLVSTVCDTNSFNLSIIFKILWLVRPSNFNLGYYIISNQAHQFEMKCVVWSSMNILDVVGIEFNSECTKWRI